MPSLAHFASKRCVVRKSLAIYACIPLLAGACENVTGNDDGTLAIRFATYSATRASANVPPSSSADELVLTGTNGTLRIEDIRLIVSELELERTEGSCASEPEDDEDCEEFESGPFLVDLPLGTGAVTLAADQIPAGTYTELEFEVEDLSDDDDPLEPAGLQNILSQITTTYPNFPRSASMVVKGTFTPVGGSARPFIVYFDAEIEVEKDLIPPVTVPEATAITVHVNPDAWFKKGSQVVDLSQLNGRLIEFELEIESGFEDVEIDD